MWCGGLLWLVVSAVVYRCDLMCRLIKLHSRGCVGGQIRLAGCVSIGEYVAQLALLVWGWVGWMARSKSGFLTWPYTRPNTTPTKLVVLHTPQWTHNQPTRSDCLHSHSTTPHAAKIPLSRQLLKMGTRWPETC